MGRKYLTVFCCFICCVCFMACSNEGQEKVEEDIKLYGNLEIKDEDGNLIINIEDIKSVEISTIMENGSPKEYIVGIEFSEEGTTKFAEVTKTHIGEMLYIYVDDELVSSPIINSIIEDGCVQIVGYNSYKEAENLIKQIKGSKNKEAEHILGVVKITENDGTILLESSQIEYASMETRAIGKGGSNVQVIVLYFTEEGGLIFKDKTKKLLGEEINVVVCGELVYSEILEETISNGEFVIKGFEDYSEMSEIWSKIQDGE